MRTTDDVLRSVKRYFAEVLGGDWEVRNWTDEGTFHAPLARIARSGPTLTTSRRVAADVVLPLQVHLYPEPSANATEAHRLAEQLQDTIFQAIEVGIGLAFPRRIPLYDYAGLDSSSPSEKRNYYDFVRVLDLSINSVPDSDAPAAVIVVADLRVAWSRDTTINPGYPTVESVRVTERAS